MSYREAYHEAPTWEVQNLLDAHHAEIVALAAEQRIKVRSRLPP